MSVSERQSNQACQRGHRAHWVVVQRRCNHSAFNGGHRTPSDYSTVICVKPGCGRAWRTKAGYVEQLPDRRDPRPAPVLERSGSGRPAPAGLTAAGLVAWIGMDDRDSPECCEACGHRFGYGKAKLNEDQRIVHRDLDCLKPGTWA